LRWLLGYQFFSIEQFTMHQNRSEFPQTKHQNDVFINMLPSFYNIHLCDCCPKDLLRSHIIL
jgi:hypothetical protein